MKHVWVNLENKTNNKVIFKYTLNQPADKLVLSASAFYTVYFDNKLVSYGPERTADGYSRIREIPITRQNIEIKILIFDYGIPTFDKDFGQSFFGCEIFNGKSLIASTDDFKAYTSSLYINKSVKYSFQRGFVEKFDTRNIKEQELSTFEVKGINLIKGIGDTCFYNEIEFTNPKKSLFNGFKKILVPNYMNLDDLNFLKPANPLECLDYELDFEKSGLLKVKVEPNNIEKGNIYIYFDEYLENGNWTYGRSTCNDFIQIIAGETGGEIVTSTVYALKHLKIVADSPFKVTVSLILIQNDKVPEVKKTGDKKLDLILDAARNTFMQNAVDIYTDCPGRERGGWLCDSYFSALAEKFFTGKNEIERCFLENFIIGTFEEHEKGMLPMLFPSQDKQFLPNWAMFFVVELEQYYLRSNDHSLVDLGKEKIYALLKYFEQFENEFSLLENLRGWVFVEWSEAGTEDYVKGISFATNMLYAAMLESASRLYNDEKLSEKAAKIRESINKLSFDSKLYHDNALRVNGKLEVVKNHTSETCQYYALFFKINNDSKFAEFIKNEFGPLRNQNKYPEVARSNAFIGNYLRFLWLNQLGEINRIKKEATEYFYKMASYSGTLWEKDSPTASCNHGFASSIIPILLSRDLIK